MFFFVLFQFLLLLFFFEAWVLALRLFLEMAFAVLVHGKLAVVIFGLLLKWVSIIFLIHHVFLLLLVLLAVREKFEQLLVR